MKSKFYVCFLFSMVAFLVLCSLPVTATSWGYVEPRLVVDRASVIVVGRYDFTADPEYGNSVFAGYPFDIAQVYKGEAPRRIIAGIDGNDTGTANQVQESGGQFLLLLEESEDTDYLVPVSGPNGMVRMTDGSVDEQGMEKTAFYRDFLAKSSPLATYSTSSKSDMAKRIGIGGTLLSVLLILIFWFRRKRSFHRGRVNE